MSKPLPEDPNRDRKYNQRGRHTVNLHTEVYTKLGEYVSQWGDSKENVVNDAVYDVVFKRDEFLKMYAPHLTLEFSTPNTILINDTELNKTAVVKAKWNNLTKESRSLLSLKCELCESDSCIHVRYSLVLPNILRIRKEGELV